MDYRGIQARRGQSMVELIVALGIITTAVGGIYLLLARSFGVSRTVTDRYVAAALAGEGIEIVKRLIDINTNGGSPFNQNLNQGAYEADYTSGGLGPFQGRFLLFDPATGFYGYAAGAPTRFKRRIEISWVQRGGQVPEMIVHSIVTWVGRGGAQQAVDLEDHFFDWRPRP